MRTLLVTLGLGAALVAGCGKTCEQTWSRIEDCQLQDAKLREVKEQKAAFFKQCKKAKPATRKAWKACAAKSDCAAFNPCFSGVKAPELPAAETRGALCQRAWKKVTECFFKDLGADTIRSQEKRFFEECQRKAEDDDIAQLRQCLPVKACAEFTQCMSKVGRRRKDATAPAPPASPSAEPPTSVVPTPAPFPRGPNE